MGPRRAKVARCTPRGEAAEESKPASTWTLDFQPLEPRESELLWFRRVPTSPQCAMFAVEALAKQYAASQHGRASHQPKHPNCPAKFLPPKCFLPFGVATAEEAAPRLFTTRSASLSVSEIHLPVLVKGCEGLSSCKRSFLQGPKLWCSRLHLHPTQVPNL